MNAKHIKIGSTTYDIVDASALNNLISTAAFADDSTNNSSSPIKVTLTKVGNETITANLPKVSSSSAGVVPKGDTVSTQSLSTKFLRQDGTWAKPSYTVDTTYQFELDGNSLKMGTNNGSKSSIYTPTINFPVTSVANKTGVVTLSYGDIGYAINTTTSTGGALTISGSDPINIITVSTADISSVSLDSTATFILGHSYHVIFMTASNDANERTIQVTSTTASGIKYICPSTTDNIELTVPASGAGYVELDFLCIAVPVNSGDNYEFLVRGI